MIGPTFARGVNNLQTVQNVLMSTTLIKIIMLCKHGCGQNNICHSCRFGKKLLVNDSE